MTNHLGKSNGSRCNTERKRKEPIGTEKNRKDAESLKRKSSPHKVMEKRSMYLILLGISIEALVKHHIANVLILLMKLILHCPPLPCTDPSSGEGMPTFTKRQTLPPPPTSQPTRAEITACAPQHFLSPISLVWPQMPCATLKGQ